MNHEIVFKQQEQAASASSSSSSSQSNRGKRSSGANSNQRFGEYGAMTAALQGQLEHVFRTQLVVSFKNHHNYHL